MTDWDRCIDVNRKDLLPIVAEMVAMLGDGETVLRHVWLAVLAMLRPAESALRRLIAIAAKDVDVTPRARREMPTGGIPKGTGVRRRAPVFVVIDPRIPAGPPPEFGPNVRWLDEEGTSPPGRVEVSADDPTSAAALRRRIEALLAAANDIPGQARRLARMLAKKDRPIRAMRPGRPPGYRERGTRPVDMLLADCHRLALMALAEAEAPP